MKHILINLLALFICGFLFAAVPTVSNVYRNTCTRQITISYDLSADGNCKVTMLVSAMVGQVTLYSLPIHQEL